MFEGFVANLLNGYLGKYIENLDGQNLNVGILQGNVELFNLQLKPEALFELDLPIEVKAGYIGRLSLVIPWTGLYTTPVQCVVEDVYIVAGPISDRGYDAARETKLDNAIKKRKLEALDIQAARRVTESRGPEDGVASSIEQESFIQKLTATVVNNIQVSLRSVHIRYEDTVTNPHHPFACGLMLREVSMETMNKQWRPEQIDSTAPIIHKLLEMLELSVYWNAHLPEQSLIRNKLLTSAWRNQLKASITAHKIGSEDFDFLLRQVSMTAKLVFNKDERSLMPLMLLDVVMEELHMLLSRPQFLSMLSVHESFRMMAVNQRYRKYRTFLETTGNHTKLWKYAYTAVCEEFIRPFSWQRIKQHRKLYKEYKNLYKRKLAGMESIKEGIHELECHLDLANIVVAREQAKLEFALEAPSRVTKIKQKTGFFSSLWNNWWLPNADDDVYDEEEEEIIIVEDDSTTSLPKNLPDWLRSLSAEEQKELTSAIGYSDTQLPCEHSTQYIAHKLVFSLTACSLSLLNYGKEMLKILCTETAFCFENRLGSNGFRASAKTESFVLEGVSIEHELVPIMTSVIGVYAPAIAATHVFSVEFEKCPIDAGAKSNFIAKVNIQPIEIVYDEHAVTEIVAFLHVPYITANDMKVMAYAGLDRLANFSRAGLQYVIEQHQTLDLTVNMRSPYIVLPEYGTLHRGGNVVIIDFGKLKIESELQPKSLSLEVRDKLKLISMDCTMTEIESRLYDKFIVTITEVKLLLADSGEDWHTAQTKADSEFHVLPSVGFQLAFYNTVNSQFKKLPKHKLESKLSTLKVNLSDAKLQMIADFFHHVPLPHSNSMMGLDDSVDGASHIDPIFPIMVDDEVQLTLTVCDLKQIKRAVHKNSVKKAKKEDELNRLLSSATTDSETVYNSLPDCSTKTDDWSRNLDMNTVDDPESKTNIVIVFSRFVVGEIVIQISKVEDKIELPYLMMRINRVCIDAAKTTYGAVLQARVGGIQVVDKVHLGSSGEYLELLGFKVDTDNFMSLVYRQVSPTCPEFQMVYASLQQGLIIKLSSLHITIEREAILFLNVFVQSLLVSIQNNLHSKLKHSCSTIMSASSTVGEPPCLPQPPNFVDRLASMDDLTSSSSGVKLQVVAKLNDLTVKLCDNDNDIAEINIKDLEGQFVLHSSHSVVQARLSDLSLEDLTENPLYSKILFLDDDNAFDFKMTTFHQSSSLIKSNIADKQSPIDASIQLRVGRVQAVYIYKFVAELQNFLKPFTNPELVESYKVAAQTAVYSKIQDIHDQGTRISLCVDIHAPTIRVPQHAESSNVIVIKLGDLRLENSFETSDIGQGVLQHWDHLSLTLKAVQVIRGKLTLSGYVELVHTLVEPINLSVELRRALPPHRIDLHYDIVGKIEDIKLQLTELDVKVLLFILRDNLFEEVAGRSDIVDVVDVGKVNAVRCRLQPPDLIPCLSTETTTPIIEVEEPLLSALEVMELVQQTKFNFDIEGITMTLLTEDDQGELLAPPSPGGNDHDDHDGSEGLARFAVGRVSLSGTLNNSGEVEVQLSMKSFTLTDIRLNSDLAIKQLIQSSMYDSAPLPMFTISYRRTAEGNTQIYINTGALRFNAFVQYSLTIVNFFLTPLSQFRDSYVQSPVMRAKSDMVQSAATTKKRTGRNLGTMQEEREGLVVTSHTFTMSIRLKQLEIVLFAEPTQKNSRILVLKANAAYDNFCLQERQHTEAKIKQLQIFSCIYGRTANTTSTELYPCDLELSSTCESTTGLKVDVKFSDVIMCVSATTMHILLDVVSVLRLAYNGGGNSGGNECGEGRGIGEYRVERSKAGMAGTNGLTTSRQQFDLWTVKSISPDNWLNMPEDNNDHPLINLEDSSAPIETLNIEPIKAKIFFEMQNKGFYAPSLCIQTCLDLKAYNWSKQIRMEADIALEVGYYNTQLGAWEPLIEPVMDRENSYRPWEVSFKLSRGPSHLLSCKAVDIKLDKQHGQDTTDGQMSVASDRKRRSRSEAESSETSSDSDTEMTVIKPKREKRIRHGSHSSHDSVAVHHSSIQGESDSEPDILSSISSQLQSMLSTDTSDIDDNDGDTTGEIDDETFESGDRPVFLTSKGPISVDITDNAVAASNGIDMLDETTKEDQNMTTLSLCNYIVINSSDKLLLNATPTSIKVVSDILQTLSCEDSVSLTSIYDLPAFEVYNHLGFDVRMAVTGDIKVHKENLHNVQLDSDADYLCNGSTTDGTVVDEADGIQLVDINKEEMDGLKNLGVIATSSNTRLLQLAQNHSPHSGSWIEEEVDECDGSVGHFNKLNLHETITLKLDGFDMISDISCKRAMKRLISLSPIKNGVDYCFVCESDVMQERKVITLRSPLQVRNGLTVPVQLFCSTQELGEANIDSKLTGEIGGGEDPRYTILATLEPGKMYPVPLHIAYHCRLYAVPANMLYEKSSEPIWWQEMIGSREKHKFYYCRPYPPNNNVFHFKVLWEEDDVSMLSMTSHKPLPCFTLQLCASVVLHNILPYNIHYSIEGSALNQLSQGEKVALYSANLLNNPKLQLQVMNYLGVDWTGSVELNSDLEEFKAIIMEADGNVEGKNRQLSLSIHVSQCQSMDLFVYSPYWIVNKTGLPVQIRGSRSDTLYENDDLTSALLFRFKKHRKKKAKLRVYNSKWTSSFCLDTVGSSGVVICNSKERNRKYQFLLQIELSSLKLTKIVTIIPYFVVVNSTPHHLRYMEDNEQADLWMDLQPQECCPFWPGSDSMKMYVKYQESNVSSQHFPINVTNTTILRMDKGTALRVEVSVLEKSVVIKILPCNDGDIPVRVDNLCDDVFLKLHQKNQGQVTLLSPNQSVLYTWDDPIAERTLMWNVYNRKKPSYPAFISKDGHGEVQLSIQTIRRSSAGSLRKKIVAPGGRDKKQRLERSDLTVQYDSSPDDDSDADALPMQGASAAAHAYCRQNTRTDKVVVFWVSYLDSLQRVLLLTQDESIAKKAIKITEAERATAAVFISMSGVGLSVNNELWEEVAYISVSSSTTVWEVQTKNRWKVLSMEIATWLEEQRRGGRTNVILEDIIEADLEMMEMTKPSRGALRRTYNPAIWLQYQQSEHNTYLHAQIHRLQVDNQLSDAYFPTVLYPSPTPSYIVKKSGQKPFIELIVTRRQVPENNLDTFKYIKLLVQEFNIHVDKGFLMSIYDIYNAMQVKQQESILLGQDISRANANLKDLIDTRNFIEPKRAMFEYLHLSPLKMHISLSMDGRAHTRNAKIRGDSVTADIVEFFLNSLGAKLTDMKDVELKMAFFERIRTRLSLQQLYSEIGSHYTTQALQQSYVLVLGLDVLGNPYGLVRDFTRGIGDFFYEPVVGSILEPDNYAQNLVNGVRSLIGHTVGGLAGSASVLTGSLGKTLAYLSFDGDYQKSRRRHILQQPTSLADSLFLASRTFVRGIVHGLSGVALHPIRGTQEEGLEGFFKGIGKGLMGLLTKPMGGAVDMVSMAFDGLRRAAEMGNDVVVRMRLPRYIHPLHGLKPYSEYQASGFRMLCNIEHGAYCTTDIYCAHAALTQDEKSDVLLITNKRVLLLASCKGWGSWTVDWSAQYISLVGPPVINGNKLTFKITKDDSHTNWFISDSKEVTGVNEPVMCWLHRKIEAAMRL